MQALSLYNGVAGIQAYSQALTSVSDNLANINTVGYKSTRANFGDLLYQQLNHGNPAEQQVGMGTMVAAQNLMNQSAFEHTDNPTDLAINGNGFFMVTDSGSGQLYYTRAGQFLLDRDGYMVNSAGQRLQSVNSADIQVEMYSEIGATTSQVDMVINLDASEDGHTQNVVIDPTDPSTYDYASATPIYGEGQDLNGDGIPEAVTAQSVTYYQKVTDFQGAAPAGSTQVWKASVFQYEDGVYTPATGDNQFYLHFDGTGHLVGTSGPGDPSGASYLFEGGVVGGSDAAVSNRLGESFGFTGEGGAQSILTSATVSIGAAGVTAGEQVTVGTDTYTFAGSLTQDQASAWLASQINAQVPSVDYYAVDNGDGTVTLKSQTGAAGLETTASGAQISVDQETSLEELTEAINDGLQAGGVINIPNLAALTDGVSTVTVSAGGTDYTFTYDTTQAGNNNTFFTLEHLASHISNITGLTATASGDNVYISAQEGGSLDGVAGNLVSLASSEVAGAVNMSGATLSGGSDGSDVTMVEASAVAATDPGPPSVSGVTLQLARSDYGATATITGITSTLGADLATPRDYATATEQQAAAGGSASASEATSVEVSFDLGAGVVQTVNFEYEPEGTTGSTSSAGNSEVVTMSQDGIPTGYLYDLQISEQGEVIGLYSNGQQEVLDTIGLAAFINPDALTRVGENLWSSNAQVGAVRIAAPGDQTAGALAMGELVPGALEMSGVDVTTEMVNMIAYQRAFQANSKSITTTDDMLKVAINLRT